jgi:hypothetical protein
MPGGSDSFRSDNPPATNNLSAANMVNCGPLLTMKATIFKLAQLADSIVTRLMRVPGILPAERWPSGRRHQIANLAYWVTGTEGSNPSLSAIEPRISAILRFDERKCRVRAFTQRLIGTSDRLEKPFTETIPGILSGTKYFGKDDHFILAILTDPTHLNRNAHGHSALGYLAPTSRRSGSVQPW